MSFQSFSLDPRLFAGIEALGYTAPTPIQERAIPPLLQGRDLVGVAQTGTGKTAAFALPILDRLMDGPRGRLRALVLVPTRELADQIHQAVGALGRSSGLKSATVYGGVAWGPQAKALRDADVVVACPGRLLAHLEARSVRVSALEILVLDEADRLFDMGFLPSIRRVLQQLPAGRQTMLFSATMPQEVRRLAREALRDPLCVEVGEAAPAATVSHALFPVLHGRKTALLAELLRRTEARSVIVFTRTKRRAQALARDLGDTGRTVTALQGDLSQPERRRAIDGFRQGRFDVLVATDIAARGIDISTVSHVINYDAPATADDYTHRVGRTGRATRTGEALTLVTSEDAELVRELERVLGKRLERRSVEGFEAPEIGAESRRGLRRRGSRGSAPARGRTVRSRRQWA
ncbi:MAG: DEAD/DEAH box helicase [Deltaproteobacteria bacterium]|nr:DEAD/DEAH box helicase [Deltaproteobacteria bacterium]